MKLDGFGGYEPGIVVIVVLQVGNVVIKLSVACPDEEEVRAAAGLRRWRFVCACLPRNADATLYESRRVPSLQISYARVRTIANRLHARAV